MKKLLLFLLLTTGLNAQTFVNEIGDQYRIVSGDLLTIANAYTRGASNCRIDNSEHINLTPAQFIETGYFLLNLIDRGDTFRIAHVNLIKRDHHGGSYALSGPLAYVRYTTVVFQTSLEDVNKVWFSFNYREDTGEFIGISVQRDEWVNGVRRVARANWYEYHSTSAVDTPMIAFEAAQAFFLEQERLIN